LRPTVGVSLQMVAAATNVGEETWVFEHQYAGLAVEKHPGRGNEIVALGQLSKSELGKFNAGTGKIIGDTRVGRVFSLEKPPGIGRGCIRIGRDLR